MIAYVHNWWYRFKVHDFVRRYLIFNYTIAYEVLRVVTSINTSIPHWSGWTFITLFIVNDSNVILNIPILSCTRNIYIY